MTKSLLGSRTRCIITYLLIFVFLTMTLVSCGKNLSKHYGESNTISVIPDDKEVYSVSLAFPAQNKTFRKNDPPPTFYWSLHEGYPKAYTIDIDYMNDGSYISRTVDVGITYLMTEDDWNFIKSNAPIIGGLQQIRWRIRIDYVSNPKESYCTGWSYFWISAE